jgi:cytochrome b561
MVLGILILLRLFWRWRHRPPVWPAAMPVWQRSAAALSHRALYACMLLLPLSGYVGSNFSKHGVRFFGIALAPWGPDLPAVYGFCTGVHDLSARTLTGLLCLHVAAALQHALLRRDGLWQRMWPGSPT